MKVFNVMEELVFETVDEIFEEKRKKGFDLADCEQCRLDVACYALNRLQPEYLISGRGLAHVQNDLKNDFQKQADIVALVNDGLELISRKQRPYYRDAQANPPQVREKKGSFFNFPAIIGTILNGKTFEPVENINVFLYQNEEAVPMIDRSWPNPYFIVRSTRGSFSFWPAPLKAKHKAEKREFCFEIRAEMDGCRPLRHFVELCITAEEGYRSTFSMEHAVKTGSLYLFGRSTEKEQQELGVEDF